MLRGLSKVVRFVERHPLWLVVGWALVVWRVAAGEVPAAASGWPEERSMDERSTLVDRLNDDDAQNPESREER